MRKSFLLLCLLFSIISNAQENTSYRIIKEFPGSYYPMMELAFDSPQKNAEGDYYIKLSAPIAFSAFGIGWNEPATAYQRDNISIEYRVRKSTTDWNDFKEATAFVSPDETPTGMNWTDVLFGIDEYQHQQLEVFVKVPAGVTLSEIKISLLDMSRDADPNWKPVLTVSDTKDCPVFPAYIARSGWCGSYTACHNPTYSVSTIYPTHTVIHHGASPDTYTDGAAVARSYWNYHVNTLGWNDIGYNYLTDKFGNLYQGRHNLNLPTTDVLGAHAGSSNSYSIGVNFMGNADVTLPTTVQYEKCEQFLAWWYNYRGFDPTTSASIVLQSGGTASKYRINGHKDVNVGGTSCPGTTLYAALPTIRTATKAIIDACSTPADVTPPATSITVQGNLVSDWRGTDFWTDFSDYDNTGGSGLGKSFYQILDYNGTEWRANTSEGFFNDNFSAAIHPDWTPVTGTWAINSAHLEQSDEAQTNPNIYAPLTQTAEYNYLYHFQGNMGGAAGNRRFGFFFFCSDATQTYRGNAYMIYFRSDDGRYEVYKSTGNVISAVLAQSNVTIAADTWHDFKVTYNPTTGVINTYINNNFVGTYTDPSPLQSGNHISLRTGGCIGQYDDIKVRRSRENREIVTVGQPGTEQARYESPNISQDACRINTLINDVAGNWSPVVAKNIYVDWTLPTTSSTVTGTWQTQDFQVDFTDADALSGIDRRFYQVIDYNGSEWRANAQRGFYSDNFDISLNNEWTQAVGTWAVTSNELIQTDETETNTNLWTALNQTLSNRYLYNFSMKIDGAGTNRRGGFHFMCDDATLENRGNSYFIWFRLDQQTLEFYKVYNDVFEQELVLPVNIQAAQWYDIKVVFDRITGETFVYMDDVLVGEWKDSSPYNSGNYISFRNGNSTMSVNNLKVYRTRNPQADITMGTSADDIRYQNLNPSTISAKVKSIITDKAHNLSAVYYHDLNIDWTAPNPPTSVSDGPVSDIDTSWSVTDIYANWATAPNDPNSGFAAYWYAIGTTIGGTDVVNWTPNAGDNYIHLSGLSLVDQQKYYVSVKVENGAGLLSNFTSSNGQVAALPVSTPVVEATNPVLVYPNPSNGIITIETGLWNDPELMISIISAQGKTIVIKDVNTAKSDSQYNFDLKSLNLASGLYLVKLSLKGQTMEIPVSFVR